MLHKMMSMFGLARPPVQETASTSPPVQKSTAWIYIAIAFALLVPGLVLKSNFDSAPITRMMVDVQFGRGLRFWFGVTGAVLIAFLVFYPVRKRLARRFPSISVRFWYHLHMVIGALGPILILYHANFGTSLKDINASAALWAIVLIAISGFVGHFVYTRASVDFYRTRIDVRKHLAQLAVDIKALEASEPATNSFVGRLDRLANELPESRLGLVDGVRKTYSLALHHHQLYRDMNALLADAQQRFSWPQEEYRRQRRLVGANLAASFAIARHAARRSIFEQLWARWRLFHVPLLVLATLATAVHVWSVWDTRGFVIRRAGSAAGAIATSETPTRLYTPESAIAALERLNAGMITSGQSFFANAEYVGSASCTACHREQQHEWANTWHAKMYRTPNAPSARGADNIVIGAFDGKPIKFERVRAELETDDKVLGAVNFEVEPTTVHPVTKAAGYFFTVRDPSTPGDSQTFQVALVIGGNLEQMYHVKVGNTYFPAPLRWRAGPPGVAAWQIDGNPQPQNWVFFRGGTATNAKPRTDAQLPPDRFAEAQCMGCHTTGYRFERLDSGGKLRWAMTGNGIATGVDKVGVLAGSRPAPAGTGAELGVGCEACHGPGSSHNAAQSERTDAGLVIPAKPKPLVPGRIVHPLKHLSPLQQSMMCGQCHTRGTNPVSPGTSASAHQAASPLAFPHVLPTASGKPRDRGFLPGDTDLSARFRSFGGHGQSPASFWPNDWAKQGRMQWQDMSRSAHFTSGAASCLTCHSGHAPMSKRVDSDRFQLRQSSAVHDGTNKSESQCESCHSGTGSALQPNKEMYQGSKMQLAGVTCVHCHMAPVANRAGRTTLTPKPTEKADGTYDTNPDNYGKPWDVSSHTSRVAPTGESADISPGVGMRSACIGCHSATSLRPIGRQQSDKEFDELLACRKDIVRSRMTALQARMRAVDSVIRNTTDAASRARAQAQLDRARGLVQFVAVDRSWGAHNWGKTTDTLQAAETEVGIACGGNPSCQLTEKMASNSQKCRVEILPAADPAPAPPANVPVEVKADKPRYKVGEEIRYELKVHKQSHLYCYQQDASNGDMQIVLPAPSIRTRIVTPDGTNGHVLKGDDFDLAGPLQSSRPGKFLFICHALDAALPEPLHRQWLAYHVAERLLRTQQLGIPAADPRAAASLIVPDTVKLPLLEALRAQGKEIRADVVVEP